MRLDLTVEGKNLVVKFNGELDHHTAQQIREKIDEEYRRQKLQNIILDLKGLNFMDSSGIGLIMGRYKICLNNNGKLALIHVNSRLEKILKVSGIFKIVKKYDSLAEACHIF